VEPQQCPGFGGAALLGFQAAALLLLSNADSIEPVLGERELRLVVQLRREAADS
jgi:hypothetical protein